MFVGVCFQIFVFEFLITKNRSKWAIYEVFRHFLKKFFFLPDPKNGLHAYCGYFLVCVYVKWPRWAKWLAIFFGPK